jgi:hypothetical protein
MGTKHTRKRGEGTIKKDSGYVQVKAHGHPVATLRGFAYQHRVILYDAIGPGTHPCYHCETSVTWGTDLVADHLDFDKINNHPDNLVPSCAPCNIRRSNPNVDKTECPHGHGPYDGQYANGWRYCKQCKCDKEKRRRDRKKAEALEQDDGTYKAG